MATDHGTERNLYAILVEGKWRSCIQRNVQFTTLHHAQHLGTALRDIIRHQQLVRWQTTRIQPRVHRTQWKAEHELHRLPHRRQVRLGVVTSHGDERTAQTTRLQHSMGLVGEVSASYRVDDLVEWLLPFHLPPVVLGVVDHDIGTQRLAKIRLRGRRGHEGRLAMLTVLGQCDGCRPNTTGPTKDQDTISRLDVVEHRVPGCNGAG
mmetsp:Transcript_8155/g.23440  ORF Transcript_8155/g.23440 Transcript_8155/m.23440 type:complete len:207 (-) Transcript_8155:532-1152(-)